MISLLQPSCMAQQLMGEVGCRLLVPIVQTGHFRQFFLVTPRFMLAAPPWLAGTTYLTALTLGAIFGIVVLLASELRLIYRGQSYIESLQVGHAMHRLRMPTSCRSRVQCILSIYPLVLSCWQAFANLTGALCGYAAPLVCVCDSDVVPIVCPWMLPEASVTKHDLQGRGAYAKPPMWVALQRVFGSGHPVLWLAMRWHPPPGSAAAAQCCKKST